MNRKTTWTIILLFSIAILLSIGITGIKAYDDFNEEKENQTRAISHLVSSDIVNSFNKPITVAKVMAVDANLKNNLIAYRDNPGECEDKMTDYLTSLRDGLGYKMMFVVEHNSGAYYTCDGITNFIDKNYEGSSLWYGELLRTDDDWNLDVDIEESAGWELSVFVNHKIYDERKKLIGVCGTAVEMSQLQKLLEKYELMYEVKINLTDENGLIKIDTDVDKIENEYINIPLNDFIADGEYYYETLKTGNRVINYIEDIDMYLVVTNYRDSRKDVLKSLGSLIVIDLAAIAAASAFAIFSDYKSKKEKED